MTVVASCDGFAVHWPKPEGDSLQGWYQYNWAARGAAAAAALECRCALAARPDTAECYCGEHTGSAGG